MVENLISVIIPVYNIKMNDLEECIDSILQQTYYKFEVVIVDDGSCTECAEQKGAGAVPPRPGVCTGRAEHPDDYWSDAGKRDQ